jgi:hypothetical protein
VGCSVVDLQGCRATTNIHPYRLPGEGLLKYSLAQVTGKEKSICTPGTERG